MPTKTEVPTIKLELHQRTALAELASKGNLKFQRK